MHRSAPLGFAALLAFALAACAAPPPAEPTNDDPFVPEGNAVSQNGVCPESVAFYRPLESTSQNFSLAAENYRNANSADPDEDVAARLEAFCISEVYLAWLLENDPLFTGSDPDDRNFLRLANVYEFYATQTEDMDRKREFLDESIALRERGAEAMREAGVAFDQYPRDLREGYFYYSYSDVYDDASQRQFDAFNRAYEAQPDSLDDWYIGQLVNTSAELIEDPMERADYLETLTPQIDNQGQREYLTALIEFTRTPPDPIAVGGESLAASLVNKFNADPESLSPTEREQIFAIAARADTLITNAGGDPDAVQDRYFDEIVGNILRDNPDQLSASQYYALFRRSWRRGDRSQAEEYFQQAIARSSSGAQRADFYYSRAASGLGNTSSLYQQALAAQPTHGPTLYRQAQAYARGLGSLNDARSRAAVWCLADRFNAVAATGDPRVASTARSAAARYNRSGPRAEDYFFLGWQRGQSVSVRSGSVSCTTRVR